ncbi:ABC transporter substrate-binding protein [Acetanaerobacterium elongatum]|uniref:Raffinose/stachyose/melibiose transport system substrate-binding protein n=1 Tax=Acetanaerobacterium elongatum TaxID=258515 RepID=A0A1G9UI76_9FIRM|nr:extracellular solute-binding protein [Acetanaerobacterium elongatum]SDM59543.1 raffinose/stachyose/melibiose transport system substrate-binding protein [Acetanaerobacterium elongatum]
MKTILFRALAVSVILALCFGCVRMETEYPAAQPEQPVAHEKIELNLMLNSPELDKQYRQMKDVYEAYRSNVIIQMDVRRDDYGTVLKTKLNAGEAPDIFITSAYNDNYLYQRYLYALDDQPFIQNIEPALLGGVTVNGRIWGCPLLVQSHSFIYNKTLFGAAGITALPQTLDEYRAVCEKLSQNNIQPFATGFADWWVLPQTFYPSMSDVNSGDYHGLLEATRQGTVKVGELPETAFALDVLDLVKQYGGLEPMKSTFDSQCSDFAAGKAAMIHQGSWAEQTILNQNPELKLGYLPAPRLNGTGVIAADSNLTLRVYKDSKVLDEALTFLNWLITSEYGKCWVPNQVKQLSPQKDVPVPDTPLSVQAAEAIKQKQTCTWWIFESPNDIEQPLGLALQAYVSGTRSRAQIQEDITELFAQGKTS